MLIAPTAIGRVKAHVKRADGNTAETYGFHDELNCDKKSELCERDKLAVSDIRIHIKFYLLLLLRLLSDTTLICAKRQIVLGCFAD